MWKSYSQLTKKQIHLVNQTTWKYPNLNSFQKNVQVHGSNEYVGLLGLPEQIITSLVI